MSKKQCVGASCSVFLIIICALAFHFVPILINNGAKAFVVLDKPSAHMYQGFQNASSITDIYNSYYMYNLTNLDEVMKGADPIVLEVGPYTYDSIEWTDADTIKWHPNATMDFNYHGLSIYNAVKSGALREDDIVIVPNLGWIGALDVFKPLGLGGLVATAAAEVNATLFLRLTVFEVLWGYNNTVLTQLLKTNPLLELFGLTPFIQLVANDAPTLRTVALPTSQYTGGDAGWNEPPAKSQQVLTQWAGMTTLTVPSPFWGSDYANMINGTLGNSYYTDMNYDAPIYVFVDDLYRSVILTTSMKLTYHGIPLFRYTMSTETMQSMHENPDNEAFYIHQHGFLARPPYKNQPVWITKTRFLHCNMTNVNVQILPTVDVVANWQDYDVAIDIEPITGQVFQAHKRFQINTFFNSGVNTPATIKTTYYPIIWVDLHTALPPKEVNKFMDDVIKPLRWTAACSIAGMCIGALALTCLLVWNLRESLMAPRIDEGVRKEREASMKKISLGI